MRPVTIRTSRSATTASRISLSTHDAGGVTDKDVAAAAEIDAASGPDGG